MEDNIKKMQERIMTNLDRLDGAKDNLQEEVSRSNAISQLVNTYVKTCNLVIRVEESKTGARELISNITNEK